MARRSDVQQDPRIAGDPEPYPPEGLDRSIAAHGTAPRRRGWSGGGGRWLVWAGRAILWALIIVIVVNGVRALFERSMQDTGTGTTPAETVTSAFPTTRAAAFADQFAAVYLNYDAANPQQRAERLKAFLPEGADAQFGWNGYGRMSAGAFQYAGIDVIDDHNARVSVSYQSGDARGLLSVPVYYDGGRFVVSAQPALLPDPGPAGLPQLAEPDSDSATEAELRPQLEGFFKAYAAGNQVDLQRYVANGVTIEGFNGRFAFAELKKVSVPPGGADSRKVTAVVVWAVASGDAAAPSPSQDPAGEPGGLEQAYELTIEKQGGKWFVKDIQGANRSVG
ncbi:conjugal transfer protein [Microbispora sp. H10670]|uniref:conjugal transfer protein n=1 Tax=unclassified Microbispora TaxID=2614687 RepID=UPI0016047DF7|nr:MULTISPECIES: conjugal transfer protein [unclassified Microbispora]